MMDFSDYIILVIVGICLCVGYVLKNLIPIQKINRYIPLIMAILGLLLNIWLNNGSTTPEIILAGMVSGLSSTGLYESFKQLLKL